MGRSSLNNDWCAPAITGRRACHTWDTLGAVAAGWEAALIKRVGNDVLGWGPPVTSVKLVEIRDWS